MRGRQQRWTPWCGSRGAPPAAEVEETLATIRASNDRLRETVADVQNKSFNLQNRLGAATAALGSLADELDDDALGVRGAGARRRARAMTGARRPESAASLSYFHQKGAGQPRLVPGAGAVPMRPFSAGGRS